MLTSLRNNQIREVLDVWKNINSQVFDREKKQVVEMKDEVAPQKTRDVDTEVSVDKQVETINRIIESKLTSLESLLSVLNIQQSIGRYRVDFNSATTVSDFIAAWNAFVRLYKTNGLSRTTLELIKVKIQESSTSLNAVIYGMNQLIDHIFYKGGSLLSKDLIPILQACATYRVAKSQIESLIFSFIDANSVDIEYKQILAEQSPTRRAEINRYLDKSRDITSQVIRSPAQFNEVDRMNRVNELRDLYGLDIPVGQILNTSDKDFNTLIKDHQHEQSSSKEIDDLERTNSQRDRKIQKLERDYEKAGIEIMRLEKEMGYLEELDEGDMKDEDIRKKDDDIAETQQEINDLVKIQQMKQKEAEGLIAEHKSTTQRINALVEKWNKLPVTKPATELRQKEKKKKLPIYTAAQLNTKTVKALQKIIIARGLDDESAIDQDKEDLIDLILKIQSNEEEAKEEEEEDIAPPEKGKGRPDRHFGTLFGQGGISSSSDSDSDTEEKPWQRYRRPTLGFNQARNDPYS